MIYFLKLLRAERCFIKIIFMYEYTIYEIKIKIEDGDQFGHVIAILVKMLF